MSDVVDFPGATRENTKQIFSCTNCDCRSVKFVKYGASDHIEVECSNCEWVLTRFLVEDTQES